MIETKHQDVVDIVQAKLISAEKVKSVCIKVGLVDVFGKEQIRILALVEYNCTYALFVFITEKHIPTSISDLTIERAIPIDNNFSCKVEPVVLNVDTHVLFVVCHKNLKVPFCVEISIETSNFASEVIRSKEDFSDKVRDYSWLDKYPGSPQYRQSLDMNEQPVDDIALSRQKIAQGNASNRESLLKYQLKLKEPEYTQQEEFTVFVGTWNVNGQPPSIPLTQWLSCDPEPPDVYAIGFQEIDLSKEAFLFNETPREFEWKKYVDNGVHPKAKYKLVGHSRIVGIQLIVLVNSKHYAYVRNVAIDAVGTGLLGKMGNKGGVAVRLELHNTSLCFVNSHLAAHVEEYQRRNQDYKDINARINFRRSPQAIKDHDQIYWLGDLNYRVTELNTTQVKTLLQRNEQDSLLKFDQLNQQRERGYVLLDYKEGDINFPPTYKYDLNSDIFDTSEKARPPAWTDRILWRGKGINLQVYRSHMELKISDHKPVSAVFKSEISVVDNLKYRKIHEELLKKMDKLENEFLPQVTVDQTEVIFDLIKFREPQFKEIIIANTGQVPAEFEFIKKLEESTYCKEWLRISPFSGTINPGEKCDVKLEICLLSDLKEVTDILVLHLKGGKDIFITVSGPCQRSSFTVSMEALCRTHVPILHIAEEQWKQAENREVPLHYSIPREIWCLVDHLYRHGLKTRELFESSALHEELIIIRDWLDFGSLDPIPGTVQAVAESLLSFLSYTKEPVIPYELHDACVAAGTNYFNCRQIILQKLPDVHRNVFLYICMFLQEFLKHDNGYDTKIIASLFGEVLLRDTIRNSKPQASRGKANFVYNFLVNDLSSLIIPNNK